MLSLAEIPTNIVQPLCLDDDELPARRQEEGEDLEMTEVLDNTDGLVADAVAELGSGRGAEGPYSPVRKEPRGKRPALQDTNKVTMEDRNGSWVNSCVSAGC